MSSRLRAFSVATLAAVSLACIAAATVKGGFTAAAASAGNAISAAPDFVAPASAATAIAKSAGGVAGHVRKGGTYYVYANVADTGNPASGVASVSANVSSITSSGTAVTMSAGSYTVDGVAYNRRSNLLTASSTLVAGIRPFSVTLTDAAGNARTETEPTVVADNTVPTAADVQTANGSAIAGRAQEGDTITVTYSEPPEPISVLAGWDGSATGMVVRLNNSGSGDTVTFYQAGNSTLLPLGTVNLGRTDYTGSNRTFGATGKASSMVLSGSAITITLGKQSGNASTAAGTGTMTWTPSATVTDWAGNPTSTSADTESGSADREF